MGDTKYVYGTERRFKTDKDSIILLSAKDHTDAEMDKVVAQQPKISYDEKDSIRAYSGNAYNAINKIMYNVDQNGNNAFDRNELDSSITAHQHILNLSKSLDYHINKPLTLYRGENISAIYNMLGKAKGDNISDAELSTLKGKVMPLKGFASTGYNAGRSFHEKPVFMEIKAPQGVQGRVITDISIFKHNESEVLLHNSGGLYIKDIYRDKNTKQIIMHTEYVR